MSRENRAFDTERLGAGYGFASYPTQAVELPPTWALLAGLGFLLLALGFWVRRLWTRRAAHTTS